MEDQTAGSLSSLDVAVSRVSGVLHNLGVDVEAEPHQIYINVLVPLEKLESVAKAIRDELDYGYLSMVTAVDYPDRIQIIYLAFALEHPHGIYLKADMPRDGVPDCPTLTTVWPGAEFQEREVYDLMGINFVGHPDMTRILTDDDFPGHPLRKDFSIEPDYVLMRHLRFGVDGQFAPGQAESRPDGTE